MPKKIDYYKWSKEASAEALAMRQKGTGMRLIAEHLTQKYRDRITRSMVEHHIGTTLGYKYEKPKQERTREEERELRRVMEGSPHGEKCRKLTTVVTLPLGYTYEGGTLSRGEHGNDVHNLR